MKNFQLGASLYVPATRDDLVPIAASRKYPHLRSVIFCLEDAVREEDVPWALENLQALLRQLEPAPLLRFLRVRGIESLREVLSLRDIERMDGFVLPKVSPSNIEDYFTVLQGRDRFELMLTLETVEAFDPGEMRQLRKLLDRRRKQILALRIGGADLLGLLGVRRPRRGTAYETPLGLVISQLVTVFRPFGYALTAPVFEQMNDLETLARETRLDVAHGLIGKTAIHPTQAEVIERLYRVTREEEEMAERILDPAAPAVFHLHDSLCEPSTHAAWARAIHARREIFGLAEDQAGP